MKCQIPYNFIYNKEVKDTIYKHCEVIDSIYFGFENSCRTLENNHGILDDHLKVLMKIKEDTGIKLAYVLNTVLETELSDIDERVLNMGCADIIIVALDTLFQKIYLKWGNTFEYEISRFYFHIKENQMKMLSHSSYVAFGFEKEVAKYYSIVKNKSIDAKLTYIANENCYPNCEFKMLHNANQLERNMGKKVEKFNCPYVDVRRFYDKSDVLQVHKLYNIDILKICDRAFKDERLLEELNKWIKIVEEIE